MDKDKNINEVEKGIMDKFRKMDEDHEFEDDDYGCDGMNENCCGCGGFDFAPDKMEVFLKSALAQQREAIKQKLEGWGGVAERSAYGTCDQRKLETLMGCLRCCEEVTDTPHECPKPQQQATKTESWEEGFDKIFLKSWKTLWRVEVVDFIRGLLEKQKQQQVGELKCTGSGANHDGCKIHSPYILDDRIAEAVKAERARILDMIEQKQNDESRFCNCGKKRCGYNEALSEVKKIIG